MAYSKNTWTNSDLPAISADNLNHIEDGIETAHENIDNITNNSLPNLTEYSTDEVNTGKKWINDKPIYRKVIDLGTLENKTSINVEGDYDVITDFDGYIYQSSGAKASLVEFASPSLYRDISYSKLSNNNLNIIINRSSTSSWSDWQLKIIVEYTKTTDEEVENNE